MTVDVTSIPSTTPTQVICARLSSGDEQATALWKFCTQQWLSGEEFDPEDHFVNTIPESEQSEGLVSDPEEFEEEEEDGVESEADVETELPAEVIEQILIERPYIDALRIFWLDMDIFKGDHTSIPQWAAIVDTISKMVGHVPSDPGKLVDRVERLDRARIQATKLSVKRAFLEPDTTLFEIANGRF